ncbi:hypothetical protein SSX86_017766 [Deinandra increscens subsp. villosa]|uniref:Fatty acid desaturase domain-containing protein n=1 Tax=Deinandra increscens subsp. villosa TaxID=3103831 RepID=A0AAP0D336_9ASTR
MGAGGRMNEDTADKNVLKRVPTKKTPFEISDLKKAIPLHCYKRDLSRSLYYLFADIAICFTWYQIASNLIPLLPKPLNYIAWPIYWFCQGSSFMGIWSIGHDLGHHAFSEYEWLDDAIGFVVHSAFLTPYFSFKYSHRSHHAHTNSMEYDEVWIPKRKTDTFYSEVLNNPLGNLFMTFVRLLLSFPMYFTFNIHGREYNGFVSHFYPQSPLFNDSERLQVWLSDAGMVAAFYGLYKIAAATSATWLFCIYGAPLLVMNAHFIFFTFLHHSHPSIAHYDSREWDWIRGALSTIDRDYGILNHVFHDVTCAHVVHHLISIIPHYHTVEATKAVKPILGDYYKYDDTPILKAFWRETKDCIYVEPDEGAEDSGVYWFRKFFALETIKMGAGGRMSEATTDKNVLKRVPTEKTPFEISDLKKAIPPHCFKRSIATSSYYLLRDIAICYTFYYLASNYIPLLPKPLGYIAWPIYWFCQGSSFMGIWSIGHDLGHNAFSEYQWLDDALGFVVHSSFLTPYFAFKYSHRSHHAHTNSMEYDEVWIPKRKADTFYSEVLNNPLGNLFMTFVRLLLSFPMYFTFNIHGREYDGFASHFYPKSPIFNDSERLQIWLSDAGMVAAFYGLYKIAAATSATWLFCIYGAPLLVMNAHFIFFTFLHHSHPSLAHYDSREWDWIRGALSTVDRDYGIFNTIFHDVTCAHVVHHLISTIPHYHTVEATKAIKPILGDYYKYDDTPILKAFWRETKECIFVEPDEGAENSGVYWFRSQSSNKAEYFSSLEVLGFVDNKMGAGGRMNEATTDKSVLKRVPTEKTPFEISDLKKAIPPHCFKRSIATSSYYLFRDIAICYTFYYLASNYIPLLPKPLNYIAWPIYWFCQGSSFMGIWSIGHDLGHNAFSEYQWLDDAIGFVVHSSFLTPYFSFKYSHRSHHAHTNSMEYDEVWIPKRKADTFYSEVLNNPLGNLFMTFVRLLLSFPMYFTFNIHGREYNGFASHFYPKSPIFNDSERLQIWLSDAGMIVAFYGLYKIAAATSASWLFCIYVAPLLVMNAHFIFFTFLHHSHLSLAHYDSREWDWIRGALSTVDRDYGIFNTIFHDVTCAHVVHHLISTIPHYHTVEATKAIKPILGDYYKYDDTPILKAFWRETKECIYVEPDEGAENSGVYWFRSHRVVIYELCSQTPAIKWLEHRKLKSVQQQSRILLLEVSIRVLCFVDDKMGAGGRMNETTTDKNVLKRVPTEKTPFEISDLKKAIPPHCFKRSISTSSYYLFRDIAICYTFYYLASNYIPLLPKPLSYIAWPIYWFCQGSSFMGIWSIGHDLGHNAFSEYQWLDDAIGFFVHSSFLTPYFSFKYSHRSHHAHTNSMEYDEVWIPKRKADTFYSEVLNNPLGNLFMTFVRLLLSFPMYFTFNIHGREYNGFVSHFYPQSPLFNNSERLQVWLSDAGMVAAFYGLYKIAAATSATWLFCIYGAPLLVMNAHFIFFTFLHHSHPSLAHYDSREWDWIRGALSTVDRDYGILNTVFHDVTCAHVVHHLISTIPHYHTVEATKAIKPILGDYYKYDNTPILKAFWRETKECIYVEPDEGAENSGVYWFRR